VTSSDLAFTGERFIPGAPGEIAHEHWHRYAFARRLVAGRRVADVACGEGYGSALLAAAASTVIGLDIDPGAIAHAAATYDDPRLRFAIGSATALPLPDASVDAIVSFETIEHLPADAQPAMLAEFARVLAPGGVLVLSSPNRPEYSGRRDYANPFHLHELDRDELAGLLDAAFPARRWFRQRRYVGSALWAEDGAGTHEALAGDARAVAPASPPEALYFVVVAARDAGALPPPQIALSLFSDVDEREWQRIDAQAREVLRQDGLLHESDAALARQAAHVLHLEGLVAARERIVEERDAQLAALVGERATWQGREAALAGDVAATRAALDSARQAIDALEADRRRLESAIGAQERIINYRQSARWWVQLPWLRVRNLWQRLT
jgi:SAM-dependent methyltransferase